MLWYSFIQLADSRWYILEMQFANNWMCITWLTRIFGLSRLQVGGVRLWAASIYQGKSLKKTDNVKTRSDPLHKFTPESIMFSIFFRTDFRRLRSVAKIYFLKNCSLHQTIIGEHATSWEFSDNAYSVLATTLQLCMPGTIQCVPVQKKDDELTYVKWVLTI